MLYFRCTVIQIILLFFLPTVGEVSSLTGIVFYGVFGIISVYMVIYFLLHEKIKCDKAFFFVILFFVICLISSMWALYKGIPLSDVIRGGLPFVWYVYIIIYKQSFNLEEYKRLLCLLGIIGAAFSIRIIFYYGIYVFGHDGERVTFHLLNSTSIMPMVGILIFMYFFVSKKYEGYSFIGFCVCFIAVLLTETKSMLIAACLGILSCIILWGINLFRCKPLERNGIIKRVVLIAGVTIILVCGLLFTSGLGDRWKAAVQIHESESQGTKVEVVDEGSISVRIREYQVALEAWQDSPILGQGLGYRWTAEGVDYGGAVIYMHNILAFVLTDFGGLGAIYLVGVIVAILRIWGKICISSSIVFQEKLYAGLGLGLLIMSFIYANFFATYRTIEFSFSCAIFFSILVHMHEVCVIGDKNGKIIY